MRFPWQKRRPGRGWKPQDPSPHDRSFGDMPLGGMNDRPNGQFVIPGGPNDQLWTSSCVGQSIERAIVAREAQLGLPAMPRSALSIYSVGRMSHTPRDEKLRDEGTYIRGTMQGVRKAGAALAEARPFSTSSKVVNARPDFDELTTMHDCRDLEYWWLFDSDKRAGIEAGAAAGIPFVFGTAVYDSFMRPDGPKIIDDMTGTYRGGHAMCVAGVYREGDVSIGPWVINSWGVGYRENGWFVMTWDLFNDMARDVAAIDNWQRTQLPKAA